MLDKVDALLTQAGSDREPMFSVAISIKGVDMFVQMNEVWDNWVPEGHAPARSCEAGLARELLVEILVVAAVK